MKTKGRPAQIAIEATVTRADGRVERLGTVSYWHKNPLKRAIWRLRRLLKWPLS